MSDKPGGTPSTEGEAVFGFEDLQGLREEYEERIRVMKEQHEAQLQKDGASRQELITDLTYELAAAREEGEMRARGAEMKRMSLESELRTALHAIDRIEAEVQRVKLALADALSPTDTNVATSATSAPGAPGATPAPISAVANAPVAAPSQAPSPSPAPAPAPTQPAQPAPTQLSPTQPAPVSGPVPTTPRPAEMTTSTVNWHSGAVAVAARPESSGPITAPPANVPAQASDVGAAAPTPPPVPVDPTPASTAAGARRKKIRLR